MPLAKKYTATLSKGRTGWCVIFRHPLREGPGNQKLRVRRGLGTRDEGEARNLVAQLTAILQNPDMWSPSIREKLITKFDPRIVQAFLHGIESEQYDPWGEREKFIPLPGSSDGYARLQMVGTTGSGKTTFVRQIIGTNPLTERFPSTSAAKTTTCDIEIVLGEGSFAAVVSFLPKDQVRQFIADCVSASIVSHVEKGPENEAIRRFVEHGEQKFRLNYILGNPTTASSDGEDDTDGSSEDASDEADEISPEDRMQMAEQLQTYMEEIIRLAGALSATVAVGLGQSIESLSAGDRDAFEELVESELLKDEGFHDIVDQILDDVESRFDALGEGLLQRGRDGWPVTWTWQTDDRPSFIHTVNRFSSNYAPLFGRLLTPLVQGIRVRGAFVPSWHDAATPQPKLVLLDGQGIGHTADSTSSVSTSITKRFQSTDVILLIDNAAQPLQAASCAVLSSVVSSGHSQKLVVGFTHFDDVRGDSLISASAGSDVQARKNHVISSFDNAVRAIGKSLGREAESGLRRLVPARLLFFSNIQNPLKPENRLTRRCFAQLLEIAQDAIRPPEPAQFEPVYDVANLILAIQRATQEFHDRWKGILGMVSVAGSHPEHWTRIKALTRRIAHFGQDEYDDLRPVADLINLLQTHISNYLSVPMKWIPFEPRQDKEEKRIAALDRIRQAVFTNLHDLSTERIVRTHLTEWVAAYDHRGPGSTRTRARDIRSVYESGAPVPTEMPGPDANSFLLDVRSVVREAVAMAGGSVVGWGSEPASN